MPNLPPPPETDPRKSLEQKLDRIIKHLENLDKRDRLRMWGTYTHIILTLIPLLLFLGGLWYVSAHAGEIIKKVASESAKQAAEYTQSQSSDFLKQLQNLLPKRQ